MKIFVVSPLKLRLFLFIVTPLPRMTGAVATLVVAVSSGRRGDGRSGASGSGERASSSGRGAGGRGQRAGRGKRDGSSGGNTNGGQGATRPDTAFRGAWLDPSSRNLSNTSYHKSKTTKSLIKTYGEEEYQFYVTFHVDRYIRLGRDLGRWRRDFITLKGREPQYEDMPQRIRNMEQAMLHIGFKLSDLE